MSRLPTSPTSTRPRVRPGVPLAFLGLRRRGTISTAKGSDVRPLWRSLGSTAFAWQAWDNLHCQGVGCTPVAFAWQAWDNLRCQGVGCTPWRPSGVLGLRHAPSLLRGRRGTISNCQGVGCTPWRPLWRSLGSVAFAWQAWDNLHCQGLAFLGLRRFCVAGMGQSPLPRGRMYAGVPWAPPLLRGRRGTISTAKGSDVRPGVPLAFLGLRSFCVAGVGQSPLPRGRMHALASLWRSLGSAAFAWQARDNLHCQGVGCTPWRPSGVPWAPPLLRGRRGAISTAKGSDVRPGVPLAFLGLRCFCVAGVGQAAFSLSLSLTPSHSHSLPSLTHSLPPSLPSLLPPSLTHSLPHSLTHSLTLSHSHTLTLSDTHTLTHSLTCQFGSATHTHHSLTCNQQRKDI